jgi:hypothetical protein
MRFTQLTRVRPEVFQLVNLLLADVGWCVRDGIRFRKALPRCNQINNIHPYGSCSSNCRHLENEHNLIIDRK